jgi:mono/diheme cytochrome c family protein
MNRLNSSLVCIGLFAAACGCVPGPTSGKGFTLPQGDVERGQAAFVELQCHACHTVSGIELPEITAEVDTRVQLGGKVPRISTYGELVTSVINPSHKLASGYAPETVATGGESKMTNYNEALTVQQLIDIVAFLQSKYELQPYEPTPYPILY